MGGSAREPRGRALRALLDVVGEGLALVDASGHVVWANAELARVAGAPSPEALVGAPFGKLFEGGGVGLSEPVGHAPVEHRIAPAGARPRRVVVERVALPPGAARGLGAWRVRDVTEAATEGSELVRLASELARAERAAAAARERLREERESREELLTMVSHELRTPVTVIAGYNRLLLSGRAGPLAEEPLRFIAESQKACERLNRFIGNLLEQARGLDGEGALELREASPAQLLGAVRAAFAPLVAERGVHLELDLPEGLSPVRMDPPRVEQVITNLLDNAVRHTPPGGRVRLGAKEVKLSGYRWVEVFVDDSGPGVAPEDRARIFEPYVRAGAGRQAGGLGLGLAIARRITEAHGGRIRVTGGELGGSRFSFTLPVPGEAPLPERVPGGAGA